MERDTEHVDQPDRSDDLNPTIRVYEWGYVVDGHRVPWRKPDCDNRIAEAFMDDRELMIQRERWDDQDREVRSNMTGYAIYTVDNSVYYVDAYTYERDGSTDESPIVVKFRPHNGYNKGDMHKLPMHNVSHIVVRHD